MKLVSYNIQYGFGADGRYDLERVAHVVADADIIALQEVERFWKRTGGDDQPELLGRLLPDHYWVYGPAFDMDASFRDAGGRLVNRRRQFGTMLLSRLPDRLVETASLAHAADAEAAQHPERGARMPDPHAGRSGPVLLHPSRPYRRRRAAEQIEFLLEKHRRAASKADRGAATTTSRNAAGRMARPSPNAPLAAIWMGDFNSEPGSAEYLGSPATIRIIRAPPISTGLPMPPCLPARSRATSIPM